MESNFDFNRIGKRMPYTTPPRLFDEMEENVWREIRCIPSVHRRSRLHTGLKILLVAASAGLLIILNVATHRKPPEAFVQVEQAFARLSKADRDYLLETYQEDIFMNE